MKSLQFKATEFNRKMVEMKGMYGVKSIPTSPYTEVKSFHFELDSRMEQRRKSSSSSSEGGQRNNSSDNIFSHEYCYGYLTKKSASKKPPPPPTTPPKAENRCRSPTKVKAFSFEIRDKERYTKKEEKIKNLKLAEEKLYEFHARTLPLFSPPAKAVPVKKATKPQPFNLSEGSPSYQTKLEEKLKQEEEEEKAKRQFKAQSADVVKKEPFHPVTGTTSPTNAVNITLHSELRAKQRAEFDCSKEEKERKKSEEESKLEKEKRSLEEEERKMLRKSLVHKATPIRAFKSLEIQPSSVPVTVPKAPCFEVEKRAKSRVTCSQYFGVMERT